MITDNQRPIRHALMRMAVLTTLLNTAACQEEKTSGGNVVAVAPSPAVTPAAIATSPVRRTGPAMLSTVGSGETEPTPEVDAAAGKVTIQPVDGVDTLLINGKPARYQEGGGQGASVTVAANDGLDLVGVFELPGESVAWAIIIGGTACAGTHLLVPIRHGVALPGQPIPGCDDRGTMRVEGQRIVFEAGGSTGFYEDGLVTIQGDQPAG